MLEMKEIIIDGYKKVVELWDVDAKLHGFIAIHDTTLGPALGGTRIHPYHSREEALNDALRLSKGMTYKSALAETGFGGGKSVIIADPKLHKTEELLFAFAEALNRLKGEYIAAEDVGSCADDMLIIHKRSNFVAALPTAKSSGDPSPFTAWGVYRGMQAVAKTLWDTESLKNKRIAIQGLGNVGSKLASILFWEGANLIVSDLDPELAEKVSHSCGGEVVDPKDFYQTECDILSFCAMGGTINDETIPQMRCKAIAGSANNQLLTSQHSLELMNKGILYAPDYIINAGGIINATTEFEPGGYNAKKARNKVDRIYHILIDIFARSLQEKKSTNQIADEIAEHKLKNKIGKRQTPLVFAPANNHKL